LAEKLGVNGAMFSCATLMPVNFNVNFRESVKCGTTMSSFLMPPPSRSQRCFSTAEFGLQLAQTPVHLINSIDSIRRLDDVANFHRSQSTLAHPPGTKLRLSSCGNSGSQNSHTPIGCIRLAKFSTHAANGKHFF
jgi:hypothetical protein